ncbi:MAG TPA: hypothetical protein VHW44_28955 [Pseudonocardiaceae bacterium]|jgi:hypothetical protein|nr:hypothetical protein [Pseudonocardiaceae bacterium]
MRLLLRRNAHRAVGEAIEIAAAPDTPRREQWQWHVRVTPVTDTSPAPDTLAVALSRGNGTVAAVEVTVDPAQVLAAVSSADLDRATRIDRTAGELVVFVVGTGAILVEGRHRLSELDAYVLAGDDPLTVDLHPDSAEPAPYATVRLRSTTPTPLSWVP